MKKTRRIAAMIAATALAATMVIPAMSFSASAAANTITITNVNGADDKASHEYAAYKIFGGEVQDDGSIKEIVWVDAAKAAVLGALGENEVTCADDSAKTVAAVLNGLSAEKLKAVARSLAGADLGTGTTITSGAASTLADGYYLFVDTATAPNGEDYATSFPMLQVYDASEGLEITTKGKFPTVEKKIKENDKTGDWDTDNRYNDTADFCIGDTVPFKLVGTIPDAETLGYYEKYKYVFHDTLGPEFTLLNASGAEITNLTALAAADFTVTVAGTQVTSGYTVSATGTTSITITFENLKGLGIDDAGLGNQTVVVTYNAKLNENAQIGKPGQTNEVYLEYSNNPSNSGEGTPDTGRTPTDKVIAFTYELDVTKKDSVEQTILLGGAKFYLLNSAEQYAKVENGKLVAWGAEADATLLETDGSGALSIAGLDDGAYMLWEQEAPNGYSLPEGEAAKTAFTISAKTSNSQTDNDINGAELTELKITVAGTDSAGDLDEGTVAMDVLNSSSSQLPSTGGIGTTLFILCGSVGAAMTGIYLVSKKRTKEEAAE